MNTFVIISLCAITSFYLYKAYHHIQSQYKYYVDSYGDLECTHNLGKIKIINGLILEINTNKDPTNVKVNGKLIKGRDINYTFTEKVSLKHSLEYLEFCYHGINVYLTKDDLIVNYPVPPPK